MMNRQKNLCKKSAETYTYNAKIPKCRHKSENNFAFLAKVSPSRPQWPVLRHRDLHALIMKNPSKILYCTPEWWRQSKFCGHHVSYSLFLQNKYKA
jgi:hypothetical protein